MVSFPPVGALATGWEWREAGALTTGWEWMGIWGQNFPRNTLAPREQGPEVLRWGATPDPSHPHAQICIKCSTKYSQ